jgi:hypothetical protein
MSHPILDQERVEHLLARQETSKKKGILPAWPRSDKELPLVELEVVWVRLSTLNHRTKSEQMKAIHEKRQGDLFSADPNGETAQSAQYDILSSQEGFDDLKADLKDRGQQLPAVVTAEGVLINGNRRSAALRSLFVDDDYRPGQYISCLILPSDATIVEMVDLETELQIAREFKEDYTWVNEALLIEEIFDREDKNWARVAKRMHKDIGSVREQYEKLQQLHQLVQLSNGSRFHADFVPNESAFTELSKHIRGKTGEEAASVRNAYFLGTLTGVNYRTLRHLRRANASTMVANEIATDPSLRSLMQTNVGEEDREPDILDDVLGPGDVNHGADLAPVLSFFAQQKLDQEIELDGSRVLVSDLFNSVKDAVDAAADEAANLDNDDVALTEPLSQVKKAIRSLYKATEALPRARVFTEWSEPDFRNMVKELKDAVDGLEENG